MTAVKVEQISAEEIRLSGDMIFATVLSARKSLLSLLSSASGTCRVDWSGIDRVDSSALSMWLVCQRYAQSRDLKLVLENPPSGFSSIAGLVGLADRLS